MSVRPEERDPARLTTPVTGETVFGTSVPQGSITVEDGVLVLVGDVDTQLCQVWAAQRPAGLEVQAVDARRVTFLGSPGLSLLAGLAQGRAERLPLWTTSRVVLRPLQITGLLALFDVHEDDPAG